MRAPSGPGTPDGAGPLVEITDRKDLERWLKDRPREDAVVIAVRAALRALPLLVTALEGDAARRRATLVLPTFRAIAAPWVAAVGPAQGQEFRVIDAAFAATNAHADAATVADPAAAAFVAATSAAAVIANASARAAANAADVAARFVPWSTLSADATQLERGTSPEQLAGSRLWEATLPEWASDATLKLRHDLESANEGWEVWTDWYVARLEGGFVNKALEEDRVLIDPDLWDQGPKVVNARIAELIEEHTVAATAGTASATGTAQAEGEAAQITAALRSALATPQLQAALTDFTLDPATNRIEMVPFKEDLPDFPTNRLRADHADKLSALASGCLSLANDLKEDAPNVPKALARDLRRYAKEAGKVQELANPRLMRLYGAALARAYNDHETILGLGNYLSGKLGDIVATHNYLFADYSSNSEEILEAVADLVLAQDVAPTSVALTVDKIATELIGADWGDLPIPTRDFPDLLHDQAEALRDFERQIDRTEDAATRAHLERMRRQTQSSTLATVARFTIYVALVFAIGAAPGSTAAIGLGGMGIAQFVDHLYPDTLRPHLRRVIDWLLLRDPDEK